MNHPTNTISPATAPYNNKALWCAYLIAPAVAPALFAVVFFVVGMMALSLRNSENAGTPAGVLMVPALALTVGMIASYIVAGVIGMPIAFGLRRKSRLNGYTIHGAAFTWSLVLSMLLAIAISIRPGQPVSNMIGIWILQTLFICLMLSPFILLSATTFWWIASRDKRRFSLKWVLALTAVVAVIAASLGAIFFRQ